MPVLQPLLGLLVLLGLAWLLSEDRRRFGPLQVTIGVGVQVALALLLLKLESFQTLFLYLNRLMLALDEAAREGTGFVFGYLGGADLPFAETGAGSSMVLAFRVLPLILVMSALSALLFYWRVLPLVVGAFAWVFQRTLGIGGALGVGTAANVFVGMVEAPLLVRPYLKAMTRSELFTLMTCGMATIAGTVLVVYASILGDAVPGALGHILTASVISVPAAVTVARIMVPERGAPTAGDVAPPRLSSSTMDAITRGTVDGMGLFLNIIAMLVVLIALVSLLNQVLGLLPDLWGAPVSLQRLLGTVLAPLAWLIGIPWAEAPAAGALLGTKTVLNEFIAYLDLARLGAGEFSERSRIIMTYALCGFANPGSLGIMIGGMGTMVPERRDEIVALGPRAIVAGTLSTCMTGAIVGLLI